MANEKKHSGFYDRSGEQNKGNKTQETHGNCCPNYDKMDQNVKETCKNCCAQSKQGRQSEELERNELRKTNYRK